MQHRNFFMVSNRIFELKLKPRDFTVYCCLLRHSDEKMKCFPSRRLIAKECCMDKKTVDSAIENLSALGLVQKICRHRENGNSFCNRGSRGESAIPESKAVVRGDITRVSD